MHAVEKKIILRMEYLFLQCENISVGMWANVSPGLVWNWVGLPEAKYNCLVGQIQSVDHPLATCKLRWSAMHWKLKSASKLTCVICGQHPYLHLFRFLESNPTEAHWEQWCLWINEGRNKWVANFMIPSFTMNYWRPVLFPCVNQEHFIWGKL